MAASLEDALNTVSQNNATPLMVTSNPTTDALLANLLQQLRAIYHDSLHQVTLFGSYARGEARPDSDIDVLVVLDQVVSPGLEITRIGELLSNLSLEYGQVVSCLFMDKTRFLTRQGPLLRNIRKEGILL